MVDVLYQSLITLNLPSYIRGVSTVELKVGGQSLIPSSVERLGGGTAVTLIYKPSPKSLSGINYTQAENVIESKSTRHRISLTYAPYPEIYSDLSYTFVVKDVLLAS